MGLRFSIHPTASLVTYQIEGSVTHEEVRGFLNGVIAHPHFERGFSFLGDCSKFDGDPDQDLVRAFAKDVLAKSKAMWPCRWAVVFPTPGGMAAVRLLSLLTYQSGIDFSSFRTYSEAEEWLGIGSGERRALIANN